MKKDNSFYSNKDMVETSKRGYYHEKNIFYASELNKYFCKQPKILDIACNEGQITKYLKKYGEVVGIDINSYALRKCRSKGIKCYLGTIEEFSKKHENEFDVVVAGDIIEHVFDTDVFLESIYKTLKKGGLLLLTTPNLVSFGRRVMMLFGANPFVEYSTRLPYKNFNVGHIRYYTVETLRLQVSVTGFKDIKVFGDKINLSKSTSIPFKVTKYIPTLARNLMLTAIK